MVPMPLRTSRRLRGVIRPAAASALVVATRDDPTSGGALLDEAWPFVAASGLR